MSKKLGISISRQIGVFLLRPMNQDRCEVH